MSRRECERQVALVTSGSAFEKTRAAGALGNLACNKGHICEANQDAIREAGGIAPLVALTTNGAADGKKSAARALNNLAWNNAANQTAIREAGGIAPLVALARSGAAGGCPVPLTVRGTQALVSFAPLAFKLFYAARQNAVLRRSPFPPV